MLVDDEQGFLEVSKQILEEASNFEVDTASSVDEAIQKLEQHPYDAVISDYEMPQKNGLDFLKELREQKNTIPFALFTGKGREEVAMTALNLGANGYYNKQGSPETVYGELAHGIRLSIEHKKAEEALRESEVKYRVLVENSPNFVAILQGSTVKYINGSACERLGWTFEDVTSPSFDMFAMVIPERLHGLVKENMRKRLSGEYISEYEITLKTRDGSEFSVSVRSQQIMYQGKPALEVLLADRTEFKQKEEEIKAAKEYLQLQVNQMPIALIIFDPKLHIKSWNPAAEQMFGFSEQEAIGKHPYDLIVPKQAQPHTDEIWRRLREGDETANSINENVTKDGKTIICSWTNTPLKTEDDAFTGILSMVQDITERKQMEKDLWLRAEVLNSASDMMFLRNFDGDIVYVNEAACRMLGYSREELMKMNLRELVAPEYASFIGAQIKELMEKGSLMFESAQICKDGSIMPVEINACILERDHQKFTLSAIRDITQRQNAEEALRRTEEKYGKLFEDAMDAIFVVDAETGIFVDCNRAATELIGRSKSELVGMHQRLLHPPEEGAGEFSKTFEKHRTDKGGHVIEDKIVTKNGEIRDVTIKGTPIEINGRKMLQGIFRDVTDRKKAEKHLQMLAYKLNGLSTGGCFLCESHERSFKAYADLTFHGIPGLCIIREDPEELKEKYGLNPKDALLFSSKPIKGFQVISDLQGVSLVISKFLEGNEGIVLLSGLEYLITNFGFHPVYKMLQEKRFDFLNAKSVLLVPINLDTLTSQEKALLVSELKNLK